MVHSQFTQHLSQFVNRDELHPIGVPIGYAFQMDGAHFAATPMGVMPLPKTLTLPLGICLKIHTQTKQEYDHFFHNSLIARKVLDIRVHNVETKNKYKNRG